MESLGTLIVASHADPATPRSINSIHPIAASRMKRAMGRWSGWWQAFLIRRARKQTAIALSELDTEVLRDIGVPESLLCETEAARELEKHRRAFWLWS